MPGCALDESVPGASGLSDAQAAAAIAALSSWSLIRVEVAGASRRVLLNTGALSGIAAGEIVGRDLAELARPRADPQSTANAKFSRPRAPLDAIEPIGTLILKEPYSIYIPEQGTEAIYIPGEKREETEAISPVAIAQFLVPGKKEQGTIAQFLVPGKKEQGTNAASGNRQQEAIAAPQTPKLPQNWRCIYECPPDVQAQLGSVLALLRANGDLREDFLAQLAFAPSSTWPQRLSARARSALELAGYTPESVTDASPEDLVALDGVGRKTAVPLTGTAFAPAVPPEIQRVRDACQRTPPKASWPTLAPLVGDQTTEELARKFATWRAYGWNPENYLGWISFNPDATPNRRRDQGQRDKPVEQTVDNAVDAAFIAMIREQPADSYLRQVYGAYL